MKFQSATIRKSLLFLMCCTLGSGTALSVTMAYGEGKPLPPDVQAKVEKYKKKLTEWAGHPVIVNAVKESNKKAAATTMTNVTWDALGEKDPIVTVFQTSPAGKLISKWEDDKNLVKLFARDEKANLVAAGSGTKPLLYNNSNRPPFINGMKGVWAATEAKPDPSSQRLAVQVSAPIKDGEKVIGVIHTAVDME